jgi:hypothetical protein
MRRVLVKNNSASSYYLDVHSQREAYKAKCSLHDLLRSADHASGFRLLTGAPQPITGIGYMLSPMHGAIAATGKP